MVWRIFNYIAHLFYFRHRRGHGIHSPFLFEFINGILFNAKRIEAPDRITEEHRQLRAEHSFVRRSSVSKRYGLLLYRISRWYQPQMIIELGTGMGISTLYLSYGSPGIPVHTIERDPNRAGQATRLLNRCCPGQVSIHCGEMGEKLEEILPTVPPRFLAFVDGNHRQGPTEAYVKGLLEKAGDGSVIVLDDIYWSRGMQQAWKEVTSWPEVQVSVNLFHMGVLLLRKDLPKRKIKIKF